MVNQIQIFSNPNLGEVRVSVTENNEPLFCLADLCSAVGINNHRNVRARLDEEDVRQMDTPTKGGSQSMIYVTESGMYDVILRSDAPSAKPFRKWVTSEVLPTIRKHGAYMSEQVIERTLSDPDYLIQLATTLKEEKQKRIDAERQVTQLEAQTAKQEEQLKEAAPKLKAYDDYISSDGTSTTTQIAKEYGWGAETLNRKLRELGVQYKQNGQWLLYAKYHGKGYTKSKPVTFTRSDGRSCVQMQTRWTAKGRELIHELIPLK